MVAVSLYRDEPSSDPFFQTFLKNNLLARLKALDSRVQRKGLKSLEPSRNRLIPLGTEIDSRGRVTKNSYGLFHLNWRATKDGKWHDWISAELDQIRTGIATAHGTRLKFLIWAGMGGSAEDKSMYNAVGLLARGPRCYVLDSTDPAKLKHILADMSRRSGKPLKDNLKATLVVGMAMGMTSYEPVVNLEKLTALYDKHKLDSRPNFLYMTLPGSVLDQFAEPRGYRRVELQPDNGNTTAGRHSGPLTRGSLYPLGLCGVDLENWIAGTSLSNEQIEEAWQLSSFLHAQGLAGRDKVTLLLPKPWEGAALWTKQNFEESLGKSEELGIKIVIGEKPKLANYRSPKDPQQDRAFLAVQLRGGRKAVEGPDAAKLALLRRAGYPLAAVSFSKDEPLSAYMQFIHYTVFGLGWLRNMNFVTQPSVELYKTITRRVSDQARRAGGIVSTRDWQRMKDPAVTCKYRRGVSLHVPHLSLSGAEPTQDAAALYANLLRSLAQDRTIEYGELTFFGDTRYSPRGRALRKCLDRAAESVFRACLKMPADVYEGPAMNHSYHEMIIGHGRCFSTVLLSERSETIADAAYTADYHMAQFLATQLALAERKRPVAAILLKDLEESTLASLDEFFRQVALHLR